MSSSLCLFVEYMEHRKTNNYKHLDLSSTYPTTKPYTINTKQHTPLNMKPKEENIKKRNIVSIQDLLDFIQDHPIQSEDGKPIQYDIDICKLHSVQSELIELNSFIGINDLKENILNQLLYCMQGFHEDADYMHMIIYGPPGTGKTEVAMCIGKIFSKIGILKKDKFNKVTRSDLIAGYLGQTAIKTSKVIQDTLGGVLFIDEAYSLGNREKEDIFSKECIDTLCEALSNHRNNLMVIIAGYEEDIKTCFLNLNKGLESRFPWRYTIKSYTTNELTDIFLKKITDMKWKIDFDKATIYEWFKKLHEHFPYYGRDVEIFITKIKIVHSKHVFCMEKTKRLISMKDVVDGFELYKQHKCKNDNISTREMFSMYT